MSEYLLLTASPTYQHGCFARFGSGRDRSAFSYPQGFQKPLSIDRDACSRFRVHCKRRRSQTEPKYQQLLGSAGLLSVCRHHPSVNSANSIDHHTDLALSIHRVVSLLAQSLDLNSLHDLSRTCRQVRANLLQYRRQLISQTLRCENEDVEPGPRLANSLRDLHQNWNTSGPNGVHATKITSGKIGTCARDMVGECRRCSKIVCRVCISSRDWEPEEHEDQEL